MALIERHPDVADMIVEMSLAELKVRGGVADLVESGHLIIIDDYRLPNPLEVFARLEKSLDKLGDSPIARKLKKLEAQHILDERLPSPWSRPTFKTEIGEAVFEQLCQCSRSLYRQLHQSLAIADQELKRIFELAFPQYRPFRFIPSLRLTQTLFENLHWDNHGIDADFHQARVFANLDVRPRIWHVSHRILDQARALYREHGLGRFRGRDPNEMVAYLTREVLGGMTAQWRDTFPRHRIAFDPGQVWLGESRHLSHQIYYGEAAMVYMWFVNQEDMAVPSARFNVALERLHAEMNNDPDAPRRP